MSLERIPLVSTQQPHTRCAPLPNQTPACVGLVTLRFAGSGQARSRLGRGWGWGSCNSFAGGATVVSPHHPPPHPSPTRGEGADRVCGALVAECCAWWHGAC